MEKFYGIVGFVKTIEEPKDSGIYVEKPIERHYYGETAKRVRRLSGTEVNDNVEISNTLSILADPFAYDNFCNIRYVVWMRQKWKVLSVEVMYPRLMLTIGGLYNDGRC